MQKKVDMTNCRSYFETSLNLSVEGWQDMTRGVRSVRPPADDAEARTWGQAIAQLIDELGLELSAVDLPRFEVRQENGLISMNQTICQMRDRLYEDGYYFTQTLGHESETGTFRANCMIEPRDTSKIILQSGCPYPKRSYLGQQWLANERLRKKTRN